MTGVMHEADDVPYTDYVLLGTTLLEKFTEVPSLKNKS